MDGWHWSTEKKASPHSHFLLSRTTPASTPAPRLATDAAPRPTIPRIKLVLLGDSGVGKSCLVLRYVRGTFDPASKVTVGAAYVGHSLTLSDGRTAKLEIWDTAGQVRELVGGVGG